MQQVLAGLLNCVDAGFLLRSGHGTAHVLPAGAVLADGTSYGRMDWTDSSNGCDTVSGTCLADGTIRSMVPALVDAGDVVSSCNWAYKRLHSGMVSVSSGLVHPHLVDDVAVTTLRMATVPDPAGPGMMTATEWVCACVALALRTHGNGLRLRRVHIMDAVNRCRWSSQ